MLYLLRNSVLLRFRLHNRCRYVMYVISSRVERLLSWPLRERVLAQDDVVLDHLAQLRIFLSRLFSEPYLKGRELFWIFSCKF